MRAQAILLSVLVVSCSGGDPKRLAGDSSAGRGNTGQTGGDAAGGRSSGSLPDDSLAGGGASGGGSNPAGPPPAQIGETYSGTATHYGRGDASGSCAYPSDYTLLYAAMNAVDYATSSTCDACVSVLNPETQKQVTVKITNVCPECPQGNIDLSDDAFDAIRGDNPGVAPIQWNYVPCDVGDTPIIYTFKSGSSRAWTAIHVRNGRYPVSSIEYRGASEQEWTRLYWSPPGGEWIWGYLTASEGGGGPGNNPVSVRVTDVKGHVLEEELTLPLDQEGYEALEEDADIISPRGLQFPE